MTTYRDISRAAREALVSGGFTVGPDLRDCGFSVDLLARRGDCVLLIKALGSIGDLQPADADTFRDLAAAAEAVPLLVSVTDPNRGEELLQDVVYTRHDVHAISVKTLRAFAVDGDLPLARASQRCALSADVDREALREAREARGLSQIDVGHALGLTREGVRFIESGRRAPSLDVAMDLEDFLETPLIIPIDIFSRTCECGD